MCAARMTASRITIGGGGPRKLDHQISRAVMSSLFTPQAARIFRLVLLDAAILPLNRKDPRLIMLSHVERMYAFITKVDLRHSLTSNSNSILRLIHQIHVGLTAPSLAQAGRTFQMLPSGKSTRVV